MRSPSVTGLPSVLPLRKREREDSGICMSGSSYLHLESVPCSHPVAILMDSASLSASVISFAVARLRRIARECAAWSSCRAPVSPMNWNCVTDDGCMKVVSAICSVAIGEGKIYSFGLFGWAFMAG